MIKKKNKSDNSHALTDEYTVDRRNSPDDRRSSWPS